MIQITEEEYGELMNISRMMHALEAAGLDNWEGCELAQDILQEWDDKDA